MADAIAKGVIDLQVKGQQDFRRVLKSTRQLKNELSIKDTYKKKIYIYGIAESKEEQTLVIEEAKQILDVEDVISSILLVEDLRIQKN